VNDGAVDAGAACGLLHFLLGAGPPVPYPDWNRRAVKRRRRLIAVDGELAGYSRVWLQRILRQQLGFQGVIFSDDISMAGAGVAGGYTDRTLAALTAGCDMVLICNNHEAAIVVLDELDTQPHPAAQARFMRMHGRGPQQTLAQLRASDRWQVAVRMIAGLEQAPELELGDDEIHS